MADDWILHPEDPVLEDSSLTFVDKNQKRRVSSSLFQSGNSSPEDSAVSTRQYHEIPDNLESEETYHFLGFSPAKASSLWQIWLNTSDRPEGFLGFPLRYIEDFFHEIFDSPTTVRDTVLQACGMSEELRAIFNLSQHQDLLETATTQWWLLEVVRMRSECLIQMRSESRDRAQNRFVPLEERLNLRGGYGSPQDIKPVLVPGNVEPVVPGCVVLYRGTTKNRADQFFDGNTYEIQSMPPTDFSAKSGMSYWTPDLEMAQRYAAWAKDSVKDGITRILKMTVSNDLIQKLKPCILRVDKCSSNTWDPDDWKQMVWHCRRQQKPSRYILSRFNNQKLYIGHICKGVDKALERLRWQDLSLENNTFTTGEDMGYHAIQYVFNGDEVLELVLNDPGTNICLHQ